MKVKTLEVLMLPETLMDLPEEDIEAIGNLREHPALRQIQAEGVPGGVTSTSFLPKEEFWKKWGACFRLEQALWQAGMRKFRISHATDDALGLDLNGQPVSDLGILRGAGVCQLNLDKTKVTDLTPLADLPLEALHLGETPVSDLAVFRGAKFCSTLKELWLGRTKVADLAPLAECTALRTLDLSGTAVASLEALHKLPLRTLFLGGTQIRDLSPLANLPLEVLAFNGTAIRDISALAGLPLKTIIFDGSEVADVTPLLRCPPLETIILPDGAQQVGALRALPNLRRISYRHQRDVWMEPSLSAADFWKEFDWRARLTEAGFKSEALKRRDDGTWEVNLFESPIKDLKILAGGPISVLWLGKTAISDLSPLRGMALQELAIWSTQVTDLHPLEGMPIQHLDLARTQITDLSPLRGMPLTQLKLGGCPELTDLSPLAASQALQSLVLPPNAKGFEFLRTFSKLERLSFQEDASNDYRPDKTAAEFWRENDAQKK
jgi:hypothetical protein